MSLCGLAQQSGSTPAPSKGSETRLTTKKLELREEESRRLHAEGGPYTSPRRGFAYSTGSWSCDHLVDAGATAGPAHRPPSADASVGFALPPAYVAQGGGPAERRSPGREGAGPIDV